MNRYTVEIRAPRKGETIINQGRVIEMPVDVMGRPVTSEAVES